MNEFGRYLLPKECMICDLPPVRALESEAGEGDLADADAERELVNNCECNCVVSPPFETNDSVVYFEGNGEIEPLTEPKMYYVSTFVGSNPEPEDCITTTPSDEFIEYSGCFALREIDPGNGLAMEFAYNSSQGITTG